MNTILATVLASIGGLVLLTLLFFVLRVLRELRELSRQTARDDSSTALVVLQQQIDALRDQLRQSLDGNRLEIDRRLEDTNRVVGAVQRGLGEVDRQMRSVGETARELRGLQELLRSPKVRGGLGEQMLAELLAQVLPQANFTLQYTFEGNERVDAILRIGDGLVPVDSKFPLENFQRMREAQDSDEPAARAATRAFRADVRRHVDAIAKRYIRPGEGTYDFAMMYIPAEAVYQELIHQDSGDGLDLLHYALTRHVVPVSPQSFYAYLQVIVLGMRGLNIESRAKEIVARLGETENRLQRFTESFDIVLRHVGNAQRQGEEAGRRLARLDAALSSMTSVSTEAADSRVPETVPGD